MRDYETSKGLLRGIAAGFRAKGNTHAANTCDDAADAIEELLARVTDIDVGDKWISVEERLPEEYNVVLVVKDHPVDSLHGYELALRLHNGEWTGNSRKVLYWMPLPAPPKGVE